MNERRQAEQDLRATSDAIRSDAQRLVELEDMKRDLDPSDPRVLGISAQVEQLTDELEDKGTAEREVAEGLHREGQRAKPD